MGLSKGKACGKCSYSALSQILREAPGHLEEPKKSWRRLEKLGRNMMTHMKFSKACLTMKNAAGIH
jgi:hypothetical protein